MNKRVLVVEDDAALARVLRDNLVVDGYEVECVDDGSRVLARARAFIPDVIVLDVMLPGVDGFKLCESLRQQTTTPVLMLTARGDQADKLRGLNLGADDYITKPFDLREFLARVRAVLRRTLRQQERLVLGKVVIDFQTHQAHSGRRRIHLTHREFQLLAYLAERPGVVVHRDELLSRIWGYTHLPLTRSVDQAIARLRKKIEVDVTSPRFVHTVRGDGYLLTPDGAAPQPAESGESDHGGER
jgi:DNA-binding response OmpR family regulator